MKLQRAAAAALSLALCTLCVPLARSQDKYPSKPVRLVVALAPGAGADALARFLAAEPLRRELGTEVIVENRAGAGGMVGGDYVAKQKPDGYTLALFHASVVSTVTVVNPNVPYNPIRDFTPVANLVTNPLAIVVSAGSRWTSLEQMIEESKKAPGKVSCGIIGAGSHTHFNLELLKIASGADITRIPYSGGTGPIITDMLGGHLDCTSLVWPAVESLVKAGKFRALAATSAMKNFPQVPTFASKGYPQASLEVFFAVFGPAGLPQDVMAKLGPAFERTMKNPAVTEKLEQMGFAIQYQNAAQLAERVKHELVVVADVAKKANIKGE
jgi:tripartite-type tricarboxylate transporter receptor subunit TctC